MAHFAHTVIYKLEFGNAILGFRLHTAFHLPNAYIMLFHKILSFSETAKKDHLWNICLMRGQCARFSPAFRDTHTQVMSFPGHSWKPTQSSSHQPKLTQAFQWEGRDVKHVSLTADRPPAHPPPPAWPHLEVTPSFHRALGGSTRLYY